MATGKRKGSSLGLLQDAEIPCHFCITRDQQQVESTDFCVQCDSNMCKSCNKWHKKFPAMIQHSVVHIPRVAKSVALPCQFCETRDQIQVESTDFCVECTSNMCEGCTKWHKKFPPMIQHSVVGIPRGTKKKCQGGAKAFGKPASKEPADWKPISLKLRGEYKVWEDRDFRVWEKSEYECNIFGICMVGTSVIITDYDNNKIKELDSKYKVVRSLQVEGGPQGVCDTYCNNEVAVLVMYHNAVQFVRVGARLKKTRSFPVGDECWGIACSKGELFVCCGKETEQSRVRVFSLSGTPLRTILYDLNGQPVFEFARCVTVSSCSNKLYVIDGKGVITVDRQHQVVGDFQQLGNTVCAYGTCVLGNGDLLVTVHNDTNCQHFLHMSKDGSKQKVVLEIHNWTITALIYDPVNSRIITASEEDNYISVYDITY